MDRNTFSELLRTYGDRIYSHAAYFLRDRDDAADVTQEVFLRLWQRCAETERRGQAAWLMRVARNLCLDWQRRRRTVRLHLQTVEQAMQGNLRTVPPGAGDPIEDLHLQEQQRALLEALQELPSEDRSLMLMHYYQGLSFREISALLDVSENALKVRAYRARRALRDVIDRKWPGEFNAKREAG